MRDRPMTEENDRISWEMVGILARRLKYQLHGVEDRSVARVDDLPASEKALLFLVMED